MHDALYITLAHIETTIHKISSMAQECHMKMARALQSFNVQEYDKDEGYEPQTAVCNDIIMFCRPHTAAQSL